MAVKPKLMPLGDAYSLLAASLEQGSDLTSEIVPLDVYLEAPDWGAMILRPRQRLLARVLDSAANHRALDDRLVRYRFDESTKCLGWDGPKLLRTMPHCVELDEHGDYWYDEPADWAYLCSRKNKYARVFENLDDASSEPRTIVLIIGRGGGKTTFSAGLSSHQAHRIESQRDPHALFDLAPLKPLRIQNVATSAAQAGEFFDAFCSFLDRIRWFEGRHAPPKQGMVKFGKTLWAERSSSNSKSGRGRDTVVYIHDEIAFAEKTTGPRSDRKLYTAIRSAVKTRAKGKGLVLITSSPAEADGVLYELFCKAEAGELNNSLVVQLASWEMTPGETRDDYDAEYKADEDVAETEFGAQFYTGARNLLPGIKERYDDMEAAYKLVVDAEGQSLRIQPYPSQAQEERWRARERRYSRVAHVDTSEGGDRLIVWVGHVRQGFVVTDMIRAFNREVGYTKELLPFLKQIHDRVGLDQVSFDQFASHQMIQDLNDLGIEAIKVPFSQVYNDEIARNIRQVVMENRLAMPVVPAALMASADRLLDKDGWDDDDDLWPTYSLMLLRREMEVALKGMTGRAGGKRKGRLISAYAPSAGPVQTDDALDALMAGAHQAILKAGGAGAFFTLARSATGLAPGDQLPRGEAPTGARVRHEPYCKMHRGYVAIDLDPGEKSAPCPECGHTLHLKQ